MAWSPADIKKTHDAAGNPGTGTGFVNEIISGVYHAPDTVADAVTSAADLVEEHGPDAWDEYSGRNEADRQRAFNAEQAELTRAWDKMMSDTSMQRAAQDYQKAGINKMFLATKGMGASSPSGPAASSGNIDVGRNIQGGINSILQSLLLKGQLDIQKAQVNDINSAAALKQSQAGDIGATQPGRVAEINERVGLLKEQIKDVKASEAQKQALINEINARVAKLNVEIVKLGHEANSAASKAAVDKAIEEFQVGVGGDIQRWTDAVGLKGRDIAHMVGIMTGLSKFFPAKKGKLGFELPGR